MDAHSIVKLKKGFYSGLEGKPDVLVTFVDKFNDRATIRYSNGDRHEVPIAAILESSVLRIGGFNYLNRLKRFEAYENLIKSPKFYERLLQYYPETELVVQHESAPTVEVVDNAVVTETALELLREIRDSLAELVQALR